jgi:hypothetical protein
MEDDPNFLAKWKTTSIFWQNGRRPQLFSKMEDDLNFRKMEDNLNFKFFENGRRPQFFGTIEDNLNF